MNGRAMRVAAASVDRKGSGRQRRKGRNMNTRQRMPAVFVGHGSPMNAIGENRARAEWKKEGLRLGKPSVIIAISAHWMTRGLFVRRAEDNPQINDMYGFPQELYEVHYEPRGSVDYADKVLECLEGQAAVDNRWGIDHGIWSVLSNMYPDADVPVVMVSTDVTADPQTLYDIGKRLRPLRDEGAMILASGNVVHNLRAVGWDMDDGYPWADAFDRTIRDAIVGGNYDIPVHYHRVADFRKAVPTVEHYDPLPVALGAAGPEDRVRVWNDYREMGSMSMTSYTFESKES